MTKRYPGGYITKTAPTVSTTSAPGIWTMEQQAAYQKAGTWPFGGPFVYVEDVFSTYLYTGTGSSGLQIQNGIDLAGKGGLVIGKARSGANAGTVDWGWIDTARGGSSVLYSNSTAAAAGTSQISSFNADGFTLNGAWPLNYYGSPYTYGSWTFRKQPKFFDVVTWTGDGSSSRNISHSLGSTPGFIIVKSTGGASGTNNWVCWHRTFAANDYISLNQTAAKNYAGTLTNVFGGPSAIAPTSTTFTVGDEQSVNYLGATYVAYLFAHDAGGFGPTNSDNVISCGSFTTDGSGNATVNLGYEPQWLLIKSSSNTNDWTVVDNMRGWVANGGYADLNPNLSTAEDNFLVETFLPLNATGFRAQFTSGNASKTYIYIAIRRGPMKVPTDATKVFGPAVWTGTGTNPRTFTDSSWGFVGDYLHNKSRSSASYYNIDSTRLTGSGTLSSNDSGAELNSSTSVAGYPSSWNQTGFTAAAGSGSNNNFNASGETYVGYMWGRAPGFFDVVCYKGTAPTAQNVSHNLGVAPEMMVIKDRSLGEGWRVYHAALGKAAYLVLETTAASSTSTDIWNNTSPTATTFTVGNSGPVNGGTLATENFVAYLFASCPGVSKVGSYTGSGTTKQIDCGFTGGARFVLIKRTDSSGDWYYWDSARGIVAGNDPYLLMNTSAAEVTNTDYVDAYSAGFEISSTAPAAINANGGSFIFLAVA